ncbi:MAG: hypothetical protein M3Y21_07075 [Candidatus Eremiobacteraeota bacterium]|nr:hypothetical protein [Candidatus Eremiobacteraeota bacterium]
MSFLLKWLGIGVDRTANIGLRPSRTLELAAPIDRVFERCIDGLENVLGAIVRERDPQAGTIDASFGLMFSERIFCGLDTIDETHTRVRIESRRNAQAELPKGTQAIDRLAQFLMESAPK